ncbi:MAG TPA: family 1 glycosylhydrolase [Thermoanaerobaculia bacterium]|nr:family 1 glycosylhydrolase [Thermoanaerobaculia bacterium]
MNPRFPFRDRPRLWGVAVSHYQVEGGDRCDWSDWGSHACGDAVGAWQRYEDDGLLARDAGANAFRFSVSWSRVEPRRGEFDDEVLERYRRFVDHLLTLGLEPVVTLFHYTHPRWFHEKTPWTSTSSVLAFSRFAARVAQALGDRVRFWVPLNEPLVFLLAGYYEGRIPPGISDPSRINRAFDHMLAAHCAAAAEIRRVNPDAAIGIAHNMMGFAPERESSTFDGILARTAHTMYNRGILEAFATGRWKFLLPPTTTIRGRRDELPCWLDTFGVNYYSRLHLRFPGKTRLIGDFDYRDRSGFGLSDNGWEVAPKILGTLLDEVHAAGFPIVITENGIADATDRARPVFLHMHADEIRRAELRGVPVHGYFHWSLVDNYEWLDGFEPKFGLYEVDRITMERRPRASVAAFRALGSEYLSR